MSKITFRADEELVGRLEEFDASKSEVLRDALREYLDRHGDQVSLHELTGESGTSGSLDELVAARIDALVEKRLERGVGQDLNLTINLEGGGVSTETVEPKPASEDDRKAESIDGATAETEAGHPDDSDASYEVSHTVRGGKTPSDDEAPDPDSEGQTCTQCGDLLEPTHVYCPNCGEKNSHRVFCECGDELRSDWSFCPGCGRRTTAADVLDGS